LPGLLVDVSNSATRGTVIVGRQAIRGLAENLLKSPEFHPEPRDAGLASGPSRALGFLVKREIGSREVPMHDRASSCCHFGQFRLDLEEHRLFRGDMVVPLTPKAFDLLRVLVLNGGRLMLKDDLIKQVWPATFVEEANLSRVVSVLRAALRDGEDGVRYIETVPKRGYRFVAPVTRPVPRDSFSEETGFDSPKRGRYAGMLRVAAVCGCVAAIGTLTYWLVSTAPEAPHARFTAAVAPLHRQLTFTGGEGAPAISPDRTHLAYVSTREAERLLIVQNLASGQSVIAFRAPEIGNLRWSPDGTELLLFARGGDFDGLYTVPASGGPHQRIATGLFEGCWSPDGSTIAVGVFLRGRVLFFDRHGGTRSIALGGEHRWVWDIDWSPSGDRLLLLTDDSRGYARIWTVRPDGTDQRSVYEERTELRTARWAPDGRTIYFSRRHDQTVSLFKLSLKGDGPGEAAAQPLVSGLESNGVFTLSSDGRQIVYARTPYHSNLWSVGLTGSGSRQTVVKKQLTQGTALVERPRISPDGSSVVFNIGYHSRANLFVLPMAGGSPRQLTFLDALSVGGVWSHDGRQLAFASTEGGRSRVWLVPAEGGAARPVSEEQVSDSFSLAWARGSQVLYQRPGNRDYAIVDTATSRETGRLLGDGATGWVFAPEVSPDGRLIAAAWNKPGNVGLWLINRDTGARIEIHDEMLFPVGWAADGRSVYAVSSKPGLYRGLTVMLGETTKETAIVNVPIDGRPARTILMLPFEEVGGVSISPDGRTVVCAVYSSRSDVWTVEDFDATAALHARR
jgi:Tol biopolymer transport system component/DNA-binding winged helix-turn-helix (wHTH) protein